MKLPETVRNCPGHHATDIGPHPRENGGLLPGGSMPLACDERAFRLLRPDVNR